MKIKVIEPIGLFYAQQIDVRTAEPVGVQTNPSNYRSSWSKGDCGASDSGIFHGISCDCDAHDIVLSGLEIEDV